MEPDYRSYLAANILSEDRVITYRLLSRALKVHVNNAKQMLFEFHRQQNGKKPGSVHATYLIAGSKPRPQVLLRKDGEDEYMHSSPLRSSPVPHPEDSAENIRTMSITLAQEEDLDEIRLQYDKVISIHVYSLGPHSLKDLQVLTDSTREISDLYADRDPLEYAKTYGSIINSCARRRTSRRMQSPRTSVPTTSAKAFTTKDQVDAKVSVNIHSSTPSSTPSSTTSKPETKPHQSAAAKNFFAKNNIGKNSIEKKVSANPMQPKHDASNIFKSFAKAKPKLKREGTDSSAGFSGVDSPAISAAEDDVMKDVSDDEEDTFVVPVQNPKDFSDSKRKSREEKAKEAKRKAALEKMMEENDTEDAPNSAPEVDEVEDQKLEDVKANGPVAETTEVKGGRRRGRRKVKKTVTTRDDEGYLVTKEEDSWESFSEDELIVPPKPKSSSTFGPGSVKAKKAAGQGSIMSFFGKKP